VREVGAALRLQELIHSGHHVPSLFRQSLEDSGRRPSTTTGSLPGELPELKHVC
jgi:hypothetical protein